MAPLKTRTLFLSHAWEYDHHYNQLVLWFDTAANFSWKNCSVPSTDALTDKTSKGLSEGMTRQISPAQGVIVMAGMYAAHSDWIKYEINEAVRMEKTIIGVKPWGQERVPTVVSENAHVMVSWQSESIIEAVRKYI